MTSPLLPLFAASPLVPPKDAGGDVIDHGGTDTLGDLDLTSSTITAILTATLLRRRPA